MARVTKFLLQKVSELGSPDPKGFQRFLSSGLSLVYAVGKGFVEDLAKLHAMALAFKTLLSLAPFLALTFSVLKALGVHNRLEPVLGEALAPLGPKAAEITNRLIEFVDKIHAGALGVAGLATLFITVLSLMGSIEQAFNHIWGVKAARRFARKFSDYLSVLLVGPVLVFSALGVTASLQSNTLLQKLVSIEPFGTMVVGVLRLVPYLSIWGALTLLYFLVPNTRVRLKSALLGGLVAAVLWETVGWAFAVFVASSTKYYAVYSSFAILLLFLVWLHIGWVIVLLGAEVAATHQNLPAYLGFGKEKRISASARESLALHIMALVGHNFYVGELPWSVEKLGSRLQVSSALVRELLEILAESRLLIRTADGQGYVPARDLEQISIREILNCIRTYGESVDVFSAKTGQDGAVAEIFKEVDGSVAGVLKGKNLKTLVLSQEAEKSFSSR